MAEPIEITGTYKDRTGKTATNSMFATVGLTIAQLTEGLQALAQLVDPVINGVMNGLDFTVSVDLSGLTANSILVGSDVDEVGEFVFTTLENRPVEMNVPALAPGYTVVNSDELDQTDPNIAAVISMMEDGLSTTGGTIVPTDVDSNDVDNIVTARERFRNSGSRS